MGCFCQKNNSESIVDVNKIHEENDYHKKENVNINSTSQVGINSLFELVKESKKIEDHVTGRDKLGKILSEFYF